MKYVFGIFLLMKILHTLTRRPNIHRKAKADDIEVQPKIVNSMPKTRIENLQLISKLIRQS